MLCCCNTSVTWSAEFSLRVYRMLRSASMAISRMGLGFAKKLVQKEGYSELHPLLASLCKCAHQGSASIPVCATPDQGCIEYSLS